MGATRMTTGRLFRFATWGIMARPAYTLAMILALGGSVTCVTFTASVIGGFSKEIERMAFGDYPRTLIVRRNNLVESHVEAPSLNDRAWLLSELRNIEASAAWVQGEAVVRGQDETRTVFVFGALGDYRRELDAELVAGRWLGEAEASGLTRSCLIGPGLAAALGGRSVLGREIALSTFRCRVVGLYDYARSRPAARFNDAAITSFATARRYLSATEDEGSAGPRDADWLSFFMKPRVDMQEAVYKADRLLRRRAGVPLSRPSPFSYDDPQAAVRDQVRQRDALARLLWTVTLVALATGLAGYGGASFAATTARRREIAIRLAMGGSPSLILRQIILEHVMIGTLASAVGLTVGLAAVMVASAAWHWPVRFSGLSALGSVLFGCLVGLALGVVAARRAASTPPALAAKG
jgi:putative ABC transport system permease protein